MFLKPNCQRQFLRISCSRRAFICLVCAIGRTHENTRRSVSRRIQESMLLQQVPFKRDVIVRIVCARNTSRQSRYGTKDVSTPRQHLKMPGPKAISLKPLSARRSRRCSFYLFFATLKPPASGRPFPCVKIAPAIR